MYVYLNDENGQYLTKSEIIRRSWWSARKVERLLDPPEKLCKNPYGYNDIKLYALNRVQAVSLEHGVEFEEDDYADWQDMSASVIDPREKSREIYRHYLMKAGGSYA